MIWLFIFLFGHCCCFNVDTNSPILLKPDASESSSFGYSVLLDKGRAFVGAPNHEVLFDTMNIFVNLHLFSQIKVLYRFDFDPLSTIPSPKAERIGMMIQKHYKNISLLKEY